MYVCITYMYHVIQTRRREDRTLVSTPSVVVPSDAVFKMHVSFPPSRSIAHIPATRWTEKKKKTPSTRHRVYGPERSTLHTGHRCTYRGSSRRIHLHRFLAQYPGYTCMDCVSRLSNSRPTRDWLQDCRWVTSTLGLTQDREKGIRRY